MTPHHVQLVALAIQADVPTIIWGGPGIGKSEMVEAIGRALGLEPRTVVLGQLDAADVAAYPAIIDGAYQLIPPPWLASTTSQSLTNFDELTVARPSVQGAALRVIRARRAADDQTPLQGRIVAAANPADQVGGTELLAPMANRFFHVTWTVDLEAWLRWMSGDTALDVPRLPDSWAELIPVWRGTIAAYVRHRGPTALYALPAVDRQGGPWPSPRTVGDLLPRLLAAAASVGAEELRPAIMAGCCGEGWAAECLAWLRDAELPDPAKVLAGRAAVPTRADLAYATLMAVVDLAMRQDEGKGEGDEATITKAPTVKVLESLAMVRALTLLHRLHVAGTHPADTTALAARRLARGIVRSPGLVAALQDDARWQPFAEMFRQVAS